MDVKAAAPRAAPAAARQRVINVLVGLPDNRQCEISVAPNGGSLVVNVPGTACIVPHLTARDVPLNMVYLGPQRPIEAARLKPGPILNHIADPDLSQECLKKAEQLVLQTKRACFNHPTSVQKTTRDGVARLLAGIPGLKVPPTIRTRHEGLGTLRKTISDAGLTYPLLTRIAGDHGGVSTLRIEHEGNLAEIEKINAYGRAIYLTEFVDYASKDGRFRKFRLAIIGGDLFIRHMAVGDQWLMHAGSRGENTTVEEQTTLNNFDAELAPKIRLIFSEISKRLDLDYVGVDCNVADDGTVLLFEANACMNILANSKPVPPPNMWEAPIARIKKAIVALLLAPRRWRHPPGAA